MITKTSDIAVLTDEKTKLVGEVADMKNEIFQKAVEISKLQTMYDDSEKFKSQLLNDLDHVQNERNDLNNICDDL